MIRKLVLAFSGLLFVFASFAQVDYNRQFFNAKQLFREGKYNLAMETFKPLIPYDQNNSFSEYASFYYALSAYHQGYKSVAKEQFNQLKKLHPKWDKIDEVNYWLARIHLENGDYFQGLKLLSSLDKKIQQDAEGIKQRALVKVTDPETLRMMYEEYPGDPIIAEQLALILTKDLSDPPSKALLEKVISQHKLQRSTYIPEAPRSFKKDRYSVSVIMPFMANTLEPTPSKKRNQIVLDLYEGMKLAVDTLAAMGTNISLRAYDSERDNKKIQQLLNTDELKNTDLIVGPFFQEESKPILDFATQNRINVINPFFNNSDLLAGNPYSFLFQPSTETIGKESGEFLARYATRKNCLVFSGTTRRDSLLAKTFMESARANGLRIIGYKAVSKENVKTILATLATPTEFDEFKYPKQFTLKKDSIGSVFVASDDPLIYAKVVSGVETRGDRAVVLGSEAWLDQTVVAFEKYQTLPIVLAAPNFIAAGDPELEAFTKKYIRTHGKVPSSHAKLGYELMLFAGRQLGENGVYFQEALDKKPFVPGFLYQGFNFQSSRNNQFVPFIQYSDDRMRVIE